MAFRDTPLSISVWQDWSWQPPLSLLIENSQTDRQTAQPWHVFVRFSILSEVFVFSRVFIYNFANLSEWLAYKSGKRSFKLKNMNKEELELHRENMKLYNSSSQLRVGTVDDPSSTKPLLK